jgi:pyruvate-formate lyase-activating enzyme
VSAAGPRWLRDLVAHAARAGVPVASASAHEGVLRLRLAPAAPGARPLDVEVVPATAGTPCFVRTARFGLRFRGPRLAPAQERQLKLLGQVVRDTEAGFPEVLEARVGVDAPGAGDGAAPGAAGFDVCTVERSVSAAGVPISSELLVRLTSRCNQQCPFCSGPPPHAEPSLPAVVAWLDAVLPQLPVPTVTLTGGEPTLWPDFDRLVADVLARPAVVRVKIQTNAVGFDDPAAARRWAPSPRLQFFVSFHGATPEIYDACTGSTHQFPRAVAGVRNLGAAGHEVVVNAVVNRHNVDHLDDWVRAIPRLFAPPPRVHFSITMSPDHRAAAADCLVRYTELSPKLQAAAGRARELGLECEPLLSSSHASIPACLIEESYRVRPMGEEGGPGALPVQREVEVGIEDLRRPGVKSRRCEACRLGRWCLGLPRAYARRFGLDELAPIA